MKWPIALALLVCIGCSRGRYDAGQLASLPPREQKVVGFYEMERSHEVSSDPAAKQLEELMSAFEGPVILECLPDKTFELIVGNIPVTGTWTVESTNVRLKIDKVSGKSASEVERVGDTSRGLSGLDFSNPDRERFLDDFMNRNALEQAKSLSQLRIGVDAKSLYTNASLPNSPFGGGFSVFKKQDKR